MKTSLLLLIFSVFVVSESALAAKCTRKVDKDDQVINFKDPKQAGAYAKSIEQCFERRAQLFKVMDEETFDAIMNDCANIRCS